MLRAALVWLAFALALAGCTPAPRAGAPGQAAASDQAQTAQRPLKRAVAGIAAVHATLQSRTVGPGRPRGYESLEPLVSAGLSNVDDRGLLRPQLAQAVPSTENGLWRVLPDGRMETTWTIQERAAWHDGVTVTANDLLFTAKVMRDRDLPNFREPSWQYVEAIEAPDARSILVRWNRPFIRADELFSDRHLVPLPMHRLESAYADNKGGFLELPYWNLEFVGTGPFKVREWVLGSHLVLTANHDYVLGRPGLDELVVKFISDPNTLIANVLTGEVDFTMGGVLSLDHAVQVRDRWRDGTADISFESWITIYPQFIGPDPVVILDAQFRRALLHALDRDELAEAIQHGLVPAAHSFLGPNAPEYRATESSVVRYAFDPRRTVQMIENLGYTRGSDGGFRDPAGSRLTLEIRALDPYEKPLLSVADYWQRVGIVVEPLVIPRARSTDQDWRSSRPGFELLRQPNAATDLERYHSREVPTRENNFTGTSKHRYMNAELDGLLDTFFTTIPQQERVRVIGRILQHISDQVVILPLYYDAVVALVGNRIQNMGVRKAQGSNDSWNAEMWDLR